MRQMGAVCNVNSRVHPEGAARRRVDGEGEYKFIGARRVDWAGQVVGAAAVGLRLNLKAAWRRAGRNHRSESVAAVYRHRPIHVPVCVGGGKIEVLESAQ